MRKFSNIAVMYHSMLPEAKNLAEVLTSVYSKDKDWLVFSHDDTAIKAKNALEGVDLLIVIGGDGTILRSAHLAAPNRIPILGVNTGRVGFMSEIDAADAVNSLDLYISGAARIEERSMLSARDENSGQTLLALNDIVIHRGAALGVIEVSTEVDGAHLASYRGDGVVIATATGSTGYALTLGGAVMDPTLENYLIKPIAAHMSQAGGVVLSPTSRVRLTVYCNSCASLITDGTSTDELPNGKSVTIERAELKTRFLRRYSPSVFWEDLSKRLGILKTPVMRKRRSGSENTE